MLNFLKGMKNGLLIKLGLFFCVGLFCTLKLSYADESVIANETKQVINNSSATNEPQATVTQTAQPTTQPKAPAKPLPSAVAVPQASAVAIPNSNTTPPTVSDNTAFPSNTDTSTATRSIPLHRQVIEMLPTSKIWDLVNNNDPKSPKNWWGLRGYLEDKGLSFNFVYTEDSAFNVAGGKKRGFAYMDNLDMQMTLDTEKLHLWHGGTFYVYGIVNGGTAQFSSKYSGDLQTASNIQAPSTTHLMELWYQQTLLHDNLSVLVGMYNLNSEFDVSTYGKLFLNSSFGIQPTMSANFTAPIFPLGSPAVRLSYKLNDNWTVLSAIFDGNPGLTNDNNATWRVLCF